MHEAGLVILKILMHELGLILLGILKQCSGFYAGSMLFAIGLVAILLCGAAETEEDLQVGILPACLVCHHGLCASVGFLAIGLLILSLSLFHV